MESVSVACNLTDGSTYSISFNSMWLLGKQSRQESEAGSESLIPTSAETAQSRLQPTEIISVVLIYDALRFSPIVQL
jgi:hypothetical protein